MKPTLRNKVASALSFAHLAGVSARAKADSEDDPDKKDPDAENDDPDHEDQDQQDGNSRKAKRADGDDPDKKDPDAEDDDPDKEDKDPDDDEGDGKAKKAKAETDDDDDDTEMHGKSSAADARRRERARCAAIFGCKAAGRNPVLAATLAFNTSMGRNEAISVLQNTTAAYSPSATRGQRNPSLGGGGQDSLTSSQSAQSRMDAAMKRVAKR